MSSRLISFQIQRERYLGKKLSPRCPNPGCDSCDNVIMSRISESHKKHQQYHRRGRRDLGYGMGELDSTLLAPDKNLDKT